MEIRRASGQGRPCRRRASRRRLEYRHEVAADNQIKNNPDEKTWDPEALNWVTRRTISRPRKSTTRIPAKTQSGARWQAHRRVKNVCVNGVVTWTPATLTLLMARWTGVHCFFQAVPLADADVIIGIKNSTKTIATKSRECWQPVLKRRTSSKPTRSPQARRGDQRQGVQRTERRLLAEVYQGTREQDKTATWWSLAAPPSTI